ncbi:Fc.00g060310.m01.CDS01 [Cosmosporella sp. VM-42]
MDDVKDPDEQGGADAMSRTLGRSPLTKTRSYSDGGGTPSKLSPSPHIIEASRRTSKDDSNIRDVPAPVTPRRPDFAPRGLALQMPPRAFTPPPAASNPYVKPAPLSPKLDHSQIYASPTNILPRRSRGLDFSRAATSLHHSTLAEQSSPNSSPTLGGRAMNIPGRRNEYGGPEQTSTSLWSVMANQEKMHVSSSLGSTQAIGSDSSSSSDDDDLMDEDMDESYVTTPQVSRIAPPMGQLPPGPFGSPAMSSLMSFQQRQRPRRQAKKKIRGPLGLGFSSTAASISRSPPSNAAHARRESISWAANQLHISAEGEESRAMNEAEGPPPDGQRSVIRRVVTRRGNMLPKTRTFARIRAALLEEGAPAEAETRREAEVVKQVRESDMDLEPRIPQPTQESTQTTTAPSSPNLTQAEPLDVAEDDMMGDIARDLSSSFKQHAMKNSKGKTFWDTFSEASSAGARTTPPPAAFLPRGSSSGISEDVAMDSPSMVGPANNGPQPPSAAEITRRINSKRRRGDDDFDPISFKRRAVSPGMSVHNSPVMQSPLQRDAGPWGSRPGSNGGDKGGSSAPSESGSTPGHVSGGSQAGAGGRLNGKGRVGFQGMIDTNDGIMRMSIE